MNLLKIGLLGIILGSISGQLYAYGTGISSYPLAVGKRLFTTELAGISSAGGGMGFQSRFMNQVNSKTTFEAGMGIAGGQRTSRIFAGADLEVFPDYQKQPRFSIRGHWENAKEFQTRKNKLSVAPTFSKGFSFWNKIGFPYISFPYSVVLDAYRKTYVTSQSVNLGISGDVPIQGYEHLIGSFEAVVGLKNSFTGFMLGLSWPIN